MRDGDKMGGVAASVTLRSSKDLICHYALETSKRGSVDGMNYHRHAGSMRSHSSENSSLAAMCVNDVRPGLAKNPSEFAESTSIP
jgi:hypothetical protein